MSDYTGPGPQVTFGDARNGATVMLADGREVTLVWISRDHARAKVRTEHGRHERLPVDQILGVVRRGDQR